MLQVRGVRALRKVALDSVEFRNSLFNEKTFEWMPSLAAEALRSWKGADLQNMAEVTPVLKISHHFSLSSA